MILKLDETGDFRPGSESPHFFVAVHVQPRTETRHADWERSLPKRYKGSAGEFKGATLPEDHLASFVAEVLKPSPTVLVTPVVMVPAEQSPETIEQHRTYSLATVNDSQLQMAMAGNAKGAKGVSEMAAWLRRMSLPIYLKMTSMDACVAHSLRDAVGHAITGGYDRELPALQYKIDRDFIRDRRQQTFWNQMLRAYVQKTMVGEEAFFSLDTWEETGHPFLDLYGRRLSDGRAVWDLTPLFRDRCHFLDSKKHFELRIADCVAAIIRRYHSGVDCRTLYPDLVQLFCGRTGPVHHLVLDPAPSSLSRSRGPG